MNKAGKLVSDSIIGNDTESIVVGGKAYIIHPPTIHKIAGAASELSEMDLKEGDSLKDILLSCKDAEKYSRALSWLVKGNLSLSDKFSHGTYEEVIEGIEKAYSMISPQVFLRAVSLTKSVSEMAARQR